MQPATRDTQPATTGCVADEACMMHRLPEAHSMQYAARSNKLREECNVQRQRPPCRKQHAPRTVRHATRTVHHDNAGCNMHRQWATATSSMQHIYGGGEGTTFGLLLRLPVSGCGCVRRCKHRQLTLRGGSQLKRVRAGVQCSRMHARVRIGVPSAPTARGGAPRSDAAAKARHS